MSEQLRKEIANCGMTQRELAVAAGVQDSVLSRFSAGDQIKSDNLDRVCGALQLKLVRGKLQKKGS